MIGPRIQFLLITRWVALMIQLEQQQHGEFVVGWWWGGGGGGVADTNYLYPARWGWINTHFFGLGIIYDMMLNMMLVIANKLPNINLYNIYLLTRYQLRKTFIFLELQ